MTPSLDTSAEALDTREQLLIAAERLIGDQGVNGASVRAITELAHANLAAVSYHFGSKRGLVREMFARRLKPINERRIEMLDDCLEESGTPDLEGIVRAMVKPPFQVLSADEAPIFGRCMVRVLSDPGEEMRDLLMELFEEVLQRFSAALLEAMPNEDPADVFWRIHFMIGTMAYTIGMGHMVEQYSAGVADMRDADRVSELAVQFITAGMSSTSAREASS